MNTNQIMNSFYFLIGGVGLFMIDLSSIILLSTAIFVAATTLFITTSDYIDLVHRAVYSILKGASITYLGVGFFGLVMQFGLLGFFLFLTPFIIFKGWMFSQELKQNLA
ncbi:hypothetical protein J2S74_002898 [Evansella vedderi]|uniref:Uncharacterized protein n=1 Tax=Evansella vedderi TaxID=38282 RepID=A0ABT9ZWA8_9BACI|nr:hypothetical protein [Evansella vedderi]MDQ0255516.1 hypothetical protein [Evansella vedderi]